MLTVLLLIVAAVLFLLQAVGVASPRLHLGWLGAGVLAIALAL